jgi:hypothetical protein
MVKTLLSPFNFGFLFGHCHWRGLRGSHPIVVGSQRDKSQSMVQAFYYDVSAKAILLRLIALVDIVVRESNRSISILSSYSVAAGAFAWSAHVRSGGAGIVLDILPVTGFCDIGVIGLTR